LVLAEPMTFDRLGGEPKLKTLVFRCESTDLEAQIYKPSFYESVSHCTIYEGPPSTVAFRARMILSEFEWDLVFPPGLRIRRHSKSDGPRRLSQGAANLSSRVWPWCKGSLEIIDSLDEEGCLAALSVLCRHLVNVIPHRPSSKPWTESRAAIAKTGHSVFQPALFSYAETLRHLPKSSSSRRAEERRRGTVATPPELAGPIVHHLWALRGQTGEPIHFGDPAIGGGVFYAHAVRLGQHLASATGIEINPVRADATAFAHRRTHLRVITGDFLSLHPELGSWNFVTANPPYRRSQEILADVSDLKRELESSLKLKISGRSDLYAYFMLAAHAWMQPNAVAAWLIPSEFTVTKAGQALREYLTQNVELLQLHSYGDSFRSLFQDVLVDPCVVFFRNASPDGNHPVRFTKGLELNRPDRSFFKATAELRARSSWNMQDLGARTGRADDSVALGEFFRVRRGIATGANAVFVLDRTQVDELRVPPALLKPLLTRAHLLPESGVVLGGADGTPVMEKPKWLIDTDLPMDQLKRLAPRLADYLEANSGLALQSALVRRRVPFYSQESQSSPRFVFGYMAKTKEMVGNDRFFLNLSQGRVLNNFLVLEATPTLQDRLDTDISLGRCLLSALRLVSQDDLERHGRRYASGLLKLEPSDLRALHISKRGWA
jgi:adenine-specific DNA-methyltransferase